MSIKIDFEPVKETVVNLAQAGVAQTRKVAAIARMKSENMAQRDVIRKTYQTIGKQYYAATKECPDEAYAELFAKIDAAIATITANDEAIEAMKVEKEVVIEVDAEIIEEVEEAPAEEAPADVAPAEEAPAEEAPAEEAPAEEIPAEEAPADAE